VLPQSSDNPPDHIGSHFAADVIKRARQNILVVRECVTSYTKACIIDDERRDTLRDGIIFLCADLRPMDGSCAVIRTDPAPGFLALRKDETLASYSIQLEIGQAKNINKNPVAEKAVRELEDELLRLDPLGSPVTRTSLAVATSTLNSRFRAPGLSSRELWTQRDQFTGSQIPLSDRDIVLNQHYRRAANHPHSEKSKCPQNKLLSPMDVTVGSMVYLNADKLKTRARDRYLVVGVSGDKCTIQKFAGNQLRSTPYHVRLYECFMVPNESNSSKRQRTLREMSSSSENEV
jgi:hypothetical protein